MSNTTEFFILINGKAFGPFTAEELAEVQGSARHPYPVVEAVDVEVVAR